MKTFYEMLEILKNKHILEYERHVDDEGYSYDDEGNVSFVGKRYASDTYGLHDLPVGREIPRRNAPDPKLVASIRKALEFKYNKFLASLLDQIEKGRGLTPKQTGIAHKVLEQLRDEYRRERASKAEPKIQGSSAPTISHDKFDVINKALSVRPNDFLAGVLDQLKRGEELTEEQKKAVRHNLYKLGMRAEADLFR